MAFKLISRPAPAPKEYLVTNGEALVYGQCVMFSNGRLTKAAAGGPVAAVTLHAVEAGTDKRCKVILVEPDQEWEADYVGTPDAGFVVGCSSADIDTGVLGGVGANLNAADVAGGPCAVLHINAAAKKAIVKFKNRQLC